MHPAVKCLLPYVKARNSHDIVWLTQAWDEFKPHKKENKHTKARERARASAFSMDSDESTDGPISVEQDSG